MKRLSGLRTDHVQESKSDSLLFLTYLGSKTSIVRLNKEIALERILNIHDFLKEFPKYSYLAVIPFVVSEPAVSQEKRTLEALLSKVTRYELQTKKGDPLEQVGQRVMRCVYIFMTL